MALALALALAFRGTRPRPCIGPYSLVLIRTTK